MTVNKILSRTIKWRCDACGQLVADGTGWVTLDQCAVDWHVYHKGCDPAPDVGYWFGVERCRTGGDALDWTLHLTGKRWFAATHWATFVRRRVLPQIERGAA